MQVTAIEIKYTAGESADKKDIQTCRTLITDKGVVRITFTRAMERSKSLPVQEKYEYHVSPVAVRDRIFSAFGWSVLAAEDKPEKGEAFWQLTVRSGGLPLRLKGHAPPALFADRLADAILSLAKFLREPILFG